MSSAMASSVSRTPVALPGGRRVAAPRRARASKLVVSAAADANHGVGRREAIAAALFSGVGLAAGKAAAAELLESLETTPNAIITEESVTGAVSEAAEEGKDSAVPPAAADPLVLGGGAAALVAAVGVAAATSPSSDESTPAAAVAPSASKALKLKKLEAAMEERNDRNEALASLRKELAKPSEEVSKASAAQGAAFESLINASRAAAAAEFEAQKSQMECDEAKAAFDEASAKDGLSKMLMGVLGNVSMDALESNFTEAEFKARSTRVLAREAALADRRAWIASWRATEALALATSNFQAKNTELGVVAALAQEAERNVESITSQLETETPAAAPAKAGSQAPFIAKGLKADAWRGVVTGPVVPVKPDATEAQPQPELSVEERLADRRQWIASWKEQQKGAGDDTMEERQAERRQWIASWREQQREASPGAGDDTMEERQAERRAWIASWRERSNVVA